MGHFRPLAFLLMVLILASGNQVGKRAYATDGFPSVFPSNGCFGVSTEIPGVEGAFAVVATDDIGGVYVVYQSYWIDNSSNLFTHVYFAYSHDYGENWSESFRINDNADPSVQCDSPSIAVDRNTGYIFVVWKDNRTGVAETYVDKSEDRGVSFSSDVTVYDWPYDYVPMGLPFTTSIKIDGDGEIHIAWIAYYSSSYTDCDIFFSRSTDGGQTFNAPITVNQKEGQARLAHPWIALDEEDVYVAYARRNSTFSGVYVVRSLNGGASFEAPVKVNDDSTKRYRGGTQINVSPDGKIHVTWTDGRAGDGTQYLDIYYAVSLDGGLSFEPNIRVNDDNDRSASGQDFTQGAHGTPAIATDSNSRIHIVWEDFRNFVNETTYCRDIYYASSEAGTKFTMNLRANSVASDSDSVNCADPNVAIDAQNNLLIVYSDAPSGNNEHHQIYFVLAASSTWQWTTLVDWAHYHNYAEMATILSALNDTYPYVVDVFSIGKSWSFRDIYCVRLTNESKVEPKPEVLFVGYHHAQEWISAELPLYYVVSATTKFGLNKNTTDLLNSHEIYVIVALNVDGLELAETNDRQRKNARPVDEDGDGSYDEDPPEDLNANGLIEILLNRTNPYDPEFLGYEGTDNDSDGEDSEDWIGGVDLNRNYPIGWENAVSDPASPVYRGPASFSEVETQAIRDFVLERNFTHAISFHSGLEFIIYPWGYTADPTPDDAKFVEIAQKLSNITGGTPYASPTVNYGIWDDWMYGEAGVLALTCEIFRNGTWMDATIAPGPYPNTDWIGGERWLYNPFPNSIETVIQRWLPVFEYITDITRPPNVAISAITPSKSVAGQGYTTNVTVVVANYGSMIEEINVTLYLNGNALESLPAYVEAEESVTCVFTWNTSSFSFGNYTLSAVVDSVPRETTTADNTLVGSTVTVTIPGDVEGDKDVGILDLVKITGIYASKLGDAAFKPNSDINSDNSITILDVVVCTSHYGQKLT